MNDDSGDNYATRRSIVIGGLAAVFGFTVIGCTSGGDAPVVAGATTLAPPTAVKPTTSSDPDNDTTEPDEDNTTKSTKKDTNDRMPSRSKDQRELVAFALGTWTCLFGADKESLFDVEISDGSFVISTPGEADGKGTWSLDGTELTIDVPDPKGKESYLVVLEDVTMDTEEMEMTRYEVNGEDRLKKDRVRKVPVGRDGRDIMIDNRTKCAG